MDQRSSRHGLPVRACLTLALICMAVQPVLADPPHGKGKGKGKGNEHESTTPHQGGISVNVSVGEARRVALDVGARGYKPLPPGIRKNLARGKPLPPGIAKKLAPPAMIGRLPVYPGHEWRVVGTDLVLIAVATAIVVDVLLDVFS